MSSPDCLCPPLESLLDPVALRARAAPFEAIASDDLMPVLPEKRAECWRVAVALRLAAGMIESGEACVGGHIAALKHEMKIEGGTNDGL